GPGSTEKMEDVEITLV
nr:Chain C, FCHSD2 [Mus musculus]7WEG_D Chain D, FCHSD2 [Mus musculus]